MAREKIANEIHLWCVFFLSGGKMIMSSITDGDEQGLYRSVSTEPEEETRWDSPWPLDSDE